MTVKIICVGKMKEKSISAATDEYIKRLRIYSDVKIIELSEFRLPKSPSRANILEGLAKEAAGFEKSISPSDYVIALCIEGKTLSSEELSDKIKEITLLGKSSIAFLIGSSFGLDEKLKGKADFCLSFSKLTFPHQLIRLFLAEQLYRSFSIINNTGYHK